MYAYYFRLALRSFGRNKVLTALMVLAIGLGIGAAMTTLTVFSVLSGDPIPAKSDRLFHVQLDPRPAEGHVPGEEPESQLTRFDASRLLQQAKAPRQAMMSGGAVAVGSSDGRSKPFQTYARYSSADVFAMFAMPFVAGQGWSAGEDAGHARVAVISRSLSETLFGTTRVQGKALLVAGHQFRVVGVLDHWHPQPRFYDTESSSYGDPEDIWLPFNTAIELNLGGAGSTNCFGDAGILDTRAENAPCTWLQYWVELEDAAQAADYQAYLDNYSRQQREAGRFQRPPNTRLRDVMDLLTHRDVVPDDVRLQLWLSFGFLLVCLINTVGLLLAKFLRRSGEIGVRRALGASRAEIFKQCLVEAGTIGLAGGLVGLGLSLLGLWAVRQRPTDYAALAQLDAPMLALTFVLAIGASLLAGVLPAWRAMRITPAIQLKS